MEDVDEKIKKIADDGLRDMLKYFDRIHDKLFTFNNILIAGFFALAKIDNPIPSLTILIPIVNLGILVYIEYHMMEKSKLEAKIETNTVLERDRHRKLVKRTNFYSLLSIVTTTIVAGIFIYFLS